MTLPVTINVLFHKDFAEGYEIYTRLYKLLCRDYKHPFNSGLDIPVYFHTDDADGNIPEVDTTLSKHTYILLLIDQNMYMSDEWRMYADSKLTQYRVNDDTKVYAVGLYKYAFELSARLSKNQFLNFNTTALLPVWDEFQTRLFDTLIRFVTDFNNADDDHRYKQLSIFISHAKKDGKRMAEDLRDYLVQSGSKLSSFFDVNSIMEGYNFEDQLIDNVKQSIMVVIFTSEYSSREWCIREIMKARESKRPIVIVYAIDGPVDRTFPYIGNIPSISYKGDWLPVINLLLKTTLNQYHQELLLGEYKDSRTLITTTAPDAFSLTFFAEIPNTDELNIIYPEPPICKDEMVILKRVRGGDKTTFCTPMQYRRLGIDLKKRNVAISVSDNDDLFSKGIGQEMLKDATIEIIRHIFISNGKIVYGGNIEENGFTTLFRELALQYGDYCQKYNEDGSQALLTNEHFVTSFIAWPYHTEITRDQICNFRHSRVKLCFVEPGFDATEDERKNGTLVGTEEAKRDKRTLSLTKMREEIDAFEELDANNERKGLLAGIFIGGKTHGSVGNEPGLLEEFKLSLRKRPLILIGGFGGITRDILLNVLGEKHNRQLGDVSVEDLMCGNLTEDDIKILKDSTNIIEIVPIVLRILKEHT